MAFCKNMGAAERAARGLLGAGLLAWAVFGGPVWAWAGVVPLLTAAAGNCPLYSLLGFKGFGMGQGAGTEQK